MIRRKCRNLMVCLLVFALIPIAAFAADASAAVGIPIFDTASGQPEAGALHTQLPVMVSGTGSVEVVFATAVYRDATGELVTAAVDRGRFQSPGGALNTTMQIDSLQGYTFRYFAWDGTMRPYSVLTPEVLDLQAPLVGMDSVSLDWDSNAANAQYIIYRNETEVGRTGDDRYIDIGLEQNTAYTYTVRAVAGDGVTVSQPKTISVRTAVLPYAIMSDPVTENKLAFRWPGENQATDSYTVASAKGGRPCREIIALPKPGSTTGETRPGFFYYAVQRGLIQPDDRDVTFEITYFDEGTADIFVEYKSINTDGSLVIARKSSPLKRTNTGMWKTGRIRVSDANFRDDGELQSCHFRIGGGVGTCVSRVAVARTADFPSAPAYIDWQGAAAEYSQITSTADGLLTIDDGFLADVSNDPNPQAYHHLELEAAYADVSRTVHLVYQSVEGETKTAALPKDGKLELTDIVCNGLIEGADIKLTVDGGTLSDTLNRLTIRKSVPQTARARLYGDAFAYDGLTAQVRKLEEGSDGYHAAANIGGRDCRSIVRDNSAQRPYRTLNFIYFNLDDRYAYGTKDAMIEISVSYFDQGPGNLQLQYNAPGNAFKGITLATLGDSKEWKTQTVRLTDACFTNAQNPPVAADFRIGVGDADNTVYISDVSVKTVGRRTPEADKENTTMIFLAGDSTCEHYIAPANRFGEENPREGWGVELGKFFDDSVVIRNQAKGGKSSRTFLMGVDASGGQVREEGFSRMGQIASEAMPGDYLFIQFGHNDLTNGSDAASQAKHTDPSAEYIEENGQEFTSYRENLRRFAAFAKENGLQPVFLTSICERRFDANDKLDIGKAGLERYRQATREVGAELGVPVLDVAQLHEAFLNTLGDTGSETYFAVTNEQTADRTHITKQGALKICEFIAAKIQEGAAADTPEGDALKPLAALLQKVQP